jgi:hypothetical protein
LNSILRIAWTRWRIIAHINGDYVARFITNLFFFSLMIPFALGAKLFSDPLDLRTSMVPHWKERKPVGASLEEARSQF